MSLYYLHISSNQYLNIYLSIYLPIYLSIYLSSAPDTPLSDKSDTTLLTSVEGEDVGRRRGWSEEVEEGRRRLWTEEVEEARRRPVTAGHMEPMHLPGRYISNLPHALIDELIY